MPRHRTSVSATLTAPAGYVYATLAECKRTAGAWTSEAEPGRVLLERHGDSGRLTTFTVEALPTGSSRVTIAADVTVHTGMRGAIERRAVAWTLRRACRQELGRLQAIVANPAGADGWSLTVRRGAGRRDARPSPSDRASQPV